MITWLEKHIEEYGALSPQREGLTYPDVDHEREAESEGNVELDANVEAGRATRGLVNLVSTC